MARDASLSYSLMMKKKKLRELHCAVFWVAFHISGEISFLSEAFVGVALEVNHQRFPHHHYNIRPCKAVDVSGEASLVVDCSEVAPR